MCIHVVLYWLWSAARIFQTSVVAAAAAACFVGRWPLHTRWRTAPHNAHSAHTRSLKIVLQYGASTRGTPYKRYVQYKWRWPHDLNRNKAMGERYIMKCDISRTKDCEQWNHDHRDTQTQKAVALSPHRERVCRAGVLLTSVRLVYFETGSSRPNCASAEQCTAGRHCRTNSATQQSVKQCWIVSTILWCT